MNMNLVEFVKKYLLILGIPADKVEESSGKIFYTVMLSVFKEKDLTEEQAKNLEKGIDLLKQSQNQEGLEELKKVFSGDDAQNLQTSAVGKVIDYLLDMTDKIGNSLSEDKKKELADLINDLSN